MLRTSLKGITLTTSIGHRDRLITICPDLLRNENLTLPEEYQTKRPEELRYEIYTCLPLKLLSRLCIVSPEDFLRLTMDLFGENVLDGDDLQARRQIGHSSRRERLSPEMGTVVISEGGGVEDFQHGLSEGVTNAVNATPLTRDQFASEIVWRKAMIPYMINNTNRLHKNVLGHGKASVVQTLPWTHLKTDQK